MRPVTGQEIADYQRDGVVHLVDFLDDEWLAGLKTAFTEEMSTSTAGLNHLDLGSIAARMEQGGVPLIESGAGSPTGRFLVRTFNWSQLPTVRALGHSRPLPEAMASLMGAARINFFGEQAFLKEAGSMHRTAFHQDAPYFHLAGDQCCTIWMPLDVVTEDNGVMGYVRGSHRWDIHAANSFVSQAALPGSALPSLPDIEGDEDSYDIVYCPAKPGDAIVHHVRTVHGATGNTSDRDRRALAFRYLGDDIRYLERTGAAPDSQMSPTLSDGEIVDSPEFPLIWTNEDGYLLP